MYACVGKNNFFIVSTYMNNRARAQCFVAKIVI